MKIKIDNSYIFKTKIDNKDLFLLRPSSKPFVCKIPKEKKFKIEDLFEFKRGKGDLILSLIFVIFVLFLFLHFNHESGWENRNLEQKRFGKILKQQWVGPLMCMVVLLPTTIINLYESFKQTFINKKLRLPNRTLYEISEWIKSIEYIIYFLIYTFSISILGYLLSTLIFAVFLTYRLGYRSLRWIGTSLFVSLCIVIIFRTILQIKTPVNIWLYDKFPESLEIFFKIYF